MHNALSRVKFCLPCVTIGAENRKWGKGKEGEGRKLNAHGGEREEYWHHLSKGVELKLVVAGRCIQNDAEGIRVAGLFRQPCPDC